MLDNTNNYFDFTYLFPLQDNPNPFSEDDHKTLLAEFFQFSDGVVHSYICPRGCCISKEEEARLKSLKKTFRHDTFLTKQFWWLCYQEGQGLYCILCKKHGAKNLQNKESKFAEKPGVRFHADAIKGHATGKAHKDALSAEYMQRVSSIYQSISQDSDGNEENKSCKCKGKKDSGTKTEKGLQDKMAEL